MIKSLRSQYFLGSIVTLALMLGLLLWNAQALMQQALEERFSAELDLAGPLLAAAAAPRLAAHDQAGLNELLQSSLGARHLLHAELRDARGQLLASVGRHLGGSAVRSIRQPIVAAGQTLGELHLDLDASTLPSGRQRLLRNSLLIGAAILLLGLALLALWTAWVSARLSRLARASQQVAAGDYALQLPRTRVTELAQMVDGFNRMSAAIRAKMAALQDSEQQQRSLMASMSGGLLVFDAQGQLRSCNIAARRFLGLDPLAPLPERPLAELLQGRIALPPEELPWTRALRSGLPQREVLLACRNSTGEERWLSFNAEPHSSGEPPRPESVVCSIADVSRHVQTELALRQLNEGLEGRVQQRTAELRAARDAAERANQAKSQFLSRMSHELRTPLNAILGFAQLLGLSRERLRADEADKIVQIERAGWHLLELIDDVLDLSRIEAGEMSTKPEPVDVLELVGETRQMLSTLASQQAVRITIEPGPALWARADRKRLRQVLNNLLSNALKYNRRGGRVDIAVSESEDEMVRITVADTGRGMSEEQLQDLFKPFVRLEQEGDTTQGTGIGLVITRRLLELMGGRIEVSAVAGQGSVFSAWLPACAAPENAAHLPERLRHTAQALLQPRRLLYIEDNPGNAELLRSLLQYNRSYVLSIAATATRGLEMLRARRPDLLLVDIDLPDIDGIEVCRRVRADPATASLPMIALSANAMQAEVSRALEAGFDRYLSKPVDFQALLGELEELLSPARSEATGAD